MIDNHMSFQNTTCFAFKITYFTGLVLRILVYLDVPIFKYGSIQMLQMEG